MARLVRYIIIVYQLHIVSIINRGFHNYHVNTSCLISGKRTETRFSRYRWFNRPHAVSLNYPSQGEQRIVFFFLSFQLAS